MFPGNSWHNFDSQSIEIMNISIIGAGIGGLTTALALKKNNLPCTLYESAAAIKPVGAGIILANNAMQVYAYLGIDKAIRNAGNRVSKMNITTSRLSSLSEVDLTGYEQKYGQHNVAIHRGALQKILSDSLGMEHVQLGKRLEDVQQKGTGYTMLFDDGQHIDTSYLIGADGIHSKVRTALFGRHELRHSGQVCWRGICRFDLLPQYHHELNEAWGKGKRFGFVRINEQMVYWYALTNVHMANEQADLTALFTDFHPVVGELINATPKESIFYAELSDLKPISTWSSGNACLIGDAAHATTPNLGQGACQAIEDAYVLGRLTEGKTDLSAAFSEYPVLRLPKAHHIVNTSWKIGKMAQLENTFQIGIRNLFMKMTPSFVMQKQMEKIFSL